MSWAALRDAIGSTAGSVVDTVGQGVSAWTDARVQAEVQRGQQTQNRPETVRHEPVDPYVGDAKAQRDAMANLPTGQLMQVGMIVLAGVAALVVIQRL